MVVTLISNLVVKPFVNNCSIFDVLPIELFATSDTTWLCIVALWNDVPSLGL